MNPMLVIVFVARYVDCIERGQIVLGAFLRR